MLQAFAASGESMLPLIQQMGVQRHMLRQVRPQGGEGRANITQPSLVLRGRGRGDGAKVDVRELGQHGGFEEREREKVEGGVGRWSCARTKA